MAVEQLANNAATTLNGAINNSTTSVVVTSASGFPGSGNFKILIDSEIMNVTSVSGTTFTVQRGQESTTAVSHLDTAAVTCVLTKLALTNFRNDYWVHDTLANRPAAGVAGRTYRATDFPIQFRDDGTNWIAYRPGFPDFTTPDDSAFSWNNQGSNTVDTSKYGTYISGPTNGNSDSYRLRIKSHTAPKKYTTCFTPHFANSNSGGVGLLFRNSSSGKFVTNMFWSGGGSSSAIAHISENWTNTTTYGGSSNLSRIGTATLVLPLAWLEFEDDNTTIYIRTSVDGYTWNLAASFSRTAFEASGWNQVGYFIHPKDQALGMRILSWKET